MTDHQEDRYRYVIAKLMQRCAAGAAICYETERVNVCDTMAADTWRLYGRIMDGDIQHPLNELMEGFIVSEKQLETAKERVKQFVKREADLFDAGKRDE